MEDISSSVQEAVKLADYCLDTENGNDGNFHITLISAQNLPNVRILFKNRVIANVTVLGHENTEWNTESDKKNGLNPVWNCRASYSFPETSIMNQNVWIVITLYSKRKFGGDDRFIGEVKISLKALFDNWGKGGSETLTTYPVKKGNIDTGGVLNVSYRFSVKKRKFMKKFIEAGCIFLVKVATVAAMIGFD